MASKSKCGGNCCEIDGGEGIKLFGMAWANFDALSVSLMAFIRFAALVTNSPTALCHSGVLPMQECVHYSL